MMCAWCARCATAAMGLDAVWSDDFHHSIHALLIGERDGYYSDYGAPTQLAKSLWGRVRIRRMLQPFLPPSARFARGPDRTVRGSWFASRTTTRSATARGVIGWAHWLRPAMQRLACGLLLLSPCVPLLFMGEEYGEQRPFPFLLLVWRCGSCRGPCATGDARSSRPWPSSGAWKFPILRMPGHLCRPSWPGPGRMDRCKAACGTCIKICWPCAVNGRYTGCDAWRRTSLDRRTRTHRMGRACSCSTAAARRGS